jgi:N-acetylmuramoyl-L-alanine amidase
VRRCARGLIILTWLLAQVGPTVGSAVAHGELSQGIYETTTSVDVKKGPGSTYETIRTLGKGKAFELLSKEGRWLKVRLSEHEAAPGYIEARFAVPRKASATPSTKLPIPGRYLTTTALDVRSGPGEQHPIVSRIPQGTTILIIGMDADWLRIASPRGELPRYIQRHQAKLQPAD